MHELSLIANLLTKIEQLAQQEGADKVFKVSVQIGALAHISSDHFREHFVRGTRGTVAEGAELAISIEGDISSPDAQAIVLKALTMENMNDNPSNK